MVAAGCELRARFTGYESQALSPDFILVVAGRRGECRERRVAWCHACGNLLARGLNFGSGGSWVAAGQGFDFRSGGSRDLNLVARGCEIRGERW
jgi:hypothetical protein